jgi:hypothetical protein
MPDYSPGLAVCIAQAQARYGATAEAAAARCASQDAIARAVRRKGEGDRGQGRTRAQNPFKAGTDMNRWWDEGWDMRSGPDGDLILPAQGQP